MDRGNGRPVHAQVEERLRTAIQTGLLIPGAALPSSRALAGDLGVSRGVVVEAFEQLVAEGYLEATPGSGTRVAATARAGSGPSPQPPAVPLPRLDFRPGVPDARLFPRTAWLAALRRATREAPDAVFGYGDPRGAPETRAALAEYLGRVRGVVADPSRLVVLGGFAQGLGLLCRVLRERGVPRLAVEDPGHPDQRGFVVRAGAEPVAVPVDGDGLRVDALAASGAGAVLVTPAHQFPSGVVLAPTRRAALLAWARETNGLVIEDDYDAEYRYDRQPVGALQGLAPDRVVYAGSVSKGLAPGLRLGWMVPPKDLVADLAAAKRNDDLGSPILEQLALAHFVGAGELDRHLRRARVVYRARRDALVRALAREAPTVRVRGIAAGLHAVADLPAGTDEAAVVATAAEKGIGVYGLGPYRASAGDAAPALVLGYAALDEREIEEGIATLGRILNMR